MEKKTRPVGVAIGLGTLASLGVYVGLLLLSAVLLVRGTVGEGAAPGMVLACGVVASCVGGLVCVSRCPWGRMTCGLAGAGAFVGMVACVAAMCWREGTAWVSGGLPMLGAALCGGVLAGLLGRKRGKRVKRPVRRRS